MNHLEVLCCDSCRAKVAAIEARVARTDGFTHQVYADLRALLAMVEKLLGSVAEQRSALKTAQALILELLSEEQRRLKQLGEALQQEAETLLNHPPPVAE